MGVLDVGVTALNAFRTQLTTTSHNVANVNTEGYSRQITQLGTLNPTPTGVGYVGTGVQVEQISRQFDQFLMDRVRQYTSSNEDAQVYLQRASRVDNILADPDAGLSGAIQNFFNSVQDVADDPSAVTTRDVLLNNAAMLADRFHSVQDFMDGMRVEINQDMQVLVSEINTLSESIADINQAIQAASASFGGSSPNDLLDRRDTMINKLSELVNVTTVKQSDGAVNVYIGNGQGLVIGTQNYSLSTQIDDAEPDRLDIALETSGTPSVVTFNLSGGKLGGYLRFRQEVLDPTQNALGRLATGMAYAFNEQHQLGMDLNGDLGNDFFNIPVAQDGSSYASQMLLEKQNANGNTIFVADIDPAELTTSDYELTYDGASWRVYDREAQSSQAVTPVGNEITFDGITVDISAAAYANGDAFIIRPSRLAARAFDVALNDARQVAAAAPVAVANGTANTGTAQISDSGLVARLAAANLTSLPVTMTYNAGNLTVSAGSISPATYNPVTDTGDTYTLTVPNLGDFEFTFQGTPDDGDTFVFGDNTGAIGDNRNMLALADLQLDKTMRNDSSGQATSSFVNLYSTMIGDVGSQTRQALINNDTQVRLREQSQTAYDEVSGVNLDEEAANLVHFQQAYQAATQVIRVSNQLFDTLLNSVG